MLGAVTVVFLVVTVWGGDGTLAGYVQATAEASMVGGLADWFAVTALFRHPLGIPIPHTAIIVERKQQFGETLGEFIQQTFLTRDVVIERLRERRCREAGGGLAVPTRQRRPARRPRARRRGRGRRPDARRGRARRDRRRRARSHRVDAARATRRTRVAFRHARTAATTRSSTPRCADSTSTCDEHRDEFRARLAQQAPWWLPGAVEDRIFDRLLDGVRTVVDAMVEDRESSAAPPARRAARAAREPTSRPHPSSGLAASRSSTTCWPNPRCGRGRRRCGPT